MSLGNHCTICILVLGLKIQIDHLSFISTYLTEDYEAGWLWSPRINVTPETEMSPEEPDCSLFPSIQLPSKCLLRKMGEQLIEIYKGKCHDLDSLLLTDGRRIIRIFPGMLPYW